MKYLWLGTGIAPRYYQTGTWLAYCVWVLALCRKDFPAQAQVIFESAFIKAGHSETTVGLGWKKQEEREQMGK